MINLTIVIVNGIAIKFLRHLRDLVDAATPCGWGVGEVLASNFSLWALPFSAGRYDPWQVKLGMVIYPIIVRVILENPSTRCIQND